MRVLRSDEFRIHFSGESVITRSHKRAVELWEHIPGEKTWEAGSHCMAGSATGEFSDGEALKRFGRSR